MAKGQKLKEWRVEHQEQVANYYQTYYQKHRERLLLAAKEKRDKDPIVIANREIRALAKEERAKLKLERQTIIDSRLPFNTPAKRAKQRRIKFLKELGSKCIKCSYDESSFALDFDHIDPTQKEHDISDIWWWADEARIRRELRKCQILCANCHRVKTAKERGLLENIPE